MAHTPRDKDQLHAEHGNHSGGTGGHAHPDFLAHHWETPVQQFEAGKLGMWLFLATEVLLFGGLFCAYSVWRGNHPELFKYGSQFLNTKMGATNTVVLILSSLTMAWGVTAAQRNQQLLLKVMLGLTLLGAATFMGIKYVEYTHKFHEGWYPGLKFYHEPGPEADLYHAYGHGHDDHAAQPPPSHEGAGSHATTTPPASQPPAGLAGAGASGEPQAAASAPGSHGGNAAGGAAAGQAGATPTMVSQGAGLPPAEASVVPLAGAGPAGLASGAPIVQAPFELEQRHHSPTLHPLRDPVRPANAHMFFNIYFMMTGLHGIHVLVGMIVITWLLIRSFLGHFSSEYFTPVDLGGLYWHIVDLIWIFLFPLFYLI